MKGENPLSVDEGVGNVGNVHLHLCTGDNGLPKNLCLYFFPV